MKRLDSIVAELLAGVKQRAELEKNGIVVANDNEPAQQRFNRIVRELKLEAQPRNRRRKRQRRH
ncbi:hypothetical protein [Bosea sp. AS-1]|uniref:hypothetical protein n=1 Tax=Bosea sp. AS-1 TaxID=2015316 RepID=UPI0012FDC3BE|nr:hypothetical protein [Bosea sp. AS-1]